jgi:transcriptional regulator of acetoin/glycerol metabolism
MAFKNPFLSNSIIHNAWEQFVSGLPIETDKLKPYVLESWKRSAAYGINPNNRIPTFHLPEKEIIARQEENKQLLDVAKPFMSSIYSIVGNTDFIIRLSDKEGYILDHIGEKGFIARFGKTYLQNGYNLREENAGTNAIGLSLLLKKPVQIMGSEHYMSKFHDLTTSASPIKDKYNEIIGILSITGNYSMVHPHTLGMTTAAAEAIKRELRLQQVNQFLQSMNKNFYEIMETISEGIIAVTGEGNILNANALARELLETDKRKIEKYNLERFLRHKKTYERIFTLNDSIFEEELEFITGKGRKKKFIVDVSYLKTDEAPKLIVFIINEAKVIHKMVNKIVGASAIFTFNDIVGKSEKLKSTLNLAKISSGIDSTILLQGESGTGKEMFAQAIHNASCRKEKPFVFLNCGAIPRELVASELFGYVEGAFTGAREGGHAGKFELADGGTLFLDEIGDMPFDAQVSLLRVLETKRITRVGGNEVIPVDVRVIAATNKDLQKEAASGNFREDLYYRLNVFPIQIPTLRERKDDIRVFINYFIEKYSSKIQKNFSGISPEFYRALELYPWPGNVRELQNTLQLILNTAKNNTNLTYSNIPEHITDGSTISQESPESLPSLDEIEKKAIIKTLETTRYNFSKTAEILKIGRSTLYRKIEKYDISV